jgi:hypothetical protein
MTSPGKKVILKRSAVMDCWKNMLMKEMELYGETLDDIVYNTMTEDDMNKMFDNGYGGEEGCIFTVWTEKSVYFPICYDGAEWVGRVSRNPDGVPTRHLGGG